MLVTFGGLPAPLGVVSVLLLSLYLGLYNAVGTAALGVILRALRHDGAVAGAGGLGERRVPAGDAAVRLSVGGARRQPDRRAAGGAAGQRGRAVRRVAVRRVRQRRAGVRAARAAARARPDAGAAPPRRSWRSPCGARGASPTASLTRAGVADSRRPDSGQRRAEGQVGSAAGATDLHDLHRDDARRGKARRAVRHLAGVVHAVHVRGGRRRRPGHPRSRARSAGADPVRERSDGARRQAASLQRGVPDCARRQHRRGVSQDAARAVRRVHPAPALDLVPVAARGRPGDVCRRRRR